MFSLKLSNSSKKFLKKCESEINQRIIKKIEMLNENPFPSNTMRVVNQKEKVFRVRIGKYRITYVVFFEEKIIFISDIDKRSKIYNE